MYYIQIGAVVTFRIKFTDPNGAVINISDATAKKFRFTNPNGISIEKDASFSTTGTDGFAQYTCSTSDLNLAGNWKLQGFITKPGSVMVISKVLGFPVFANLPEVIP